MKSESFLFVLDKSAKLLYDDVPQIRAEIDQVESPPIFVIPGLDPAIHVDPRVKPGDDDWGVIELGRIPA